MHAASCALQSQTSDRRVTSSARKKEHTRDTAIRNGARTTRLMTGHTRHRRSFRADHHERVEKGNKRRALPRKRLDWTQFHASTDFKGFRWNADRRII